MKVGRRTGAGQGPRAGAYAAVTARAATYGAAITRCRPVGTYGGTAARAVTAVPASEEML